MASPRWTPAVALALFGTVLLLAGCGGARSGVAPNDTAMVTLGGYSFGPTSNVFTHPWFTANPHSGKIVMKGWGSQKGKQIVVTVSDGGTVAGVKTLKQSVSGSGEPSASWDAQDTQGNIHCLAVLDHGRKAPRGVAAKCGPVFVLLKASQLTMGKTWTALCPKVTDGEQARVMSTNATFRGKSGLLCVRDIVDRNGDRRFDPNWTGPDSRIDQYFGRGGRFGGLQTSATGGFAG